MHLRYIFFQNKVRYDVNHDGNAGVALLSVKVKTGHETKFSWSWDTNWNSTEQSKYVFPFTSFSIFWSFFDSFKFYDQEVITTDYLLTAGSEQEVGQKNFLKEAVSQWVDYPQGDRIKFQSLGYYFSHNLSFHQNSAVYLTGNSSHCGGYSFLILMENSGLYRSLWNQKWVYNSTVRTWRDLLPHCA